MTRLYHRKNFLDGLSSNLPLNQKLAFIHGAAKQQCSFIHRISVALPDKRSRKFRTFLSSKEKDIDHIGRKLGLPLEEVSFLMETMKKITPTDMGIEHLHEDPQNINDRCGTGYSFPMHYHDQLVGVVFFDSRRKKCFSEKSIRLLDVFGHLITNVVVQELNAILVMLAAVKTAKCLVHYRNPDTGNHIERMARFSRLIASELSKNSKYRFNEDFIEQIFIFSPLHDVGKIGIPDEVLLKSEKLNEKECEVMRTHTLIGKRIVDAIIENFGFQSYDSIDILKNIAQYHHEAMDGSGYPYGIKGRQIPIEARIIEVADIFDALTSPRPYKSAWSNEEAFALIRRIAKTKLDKDCVEALVRNAEVIVKIQKDFSDGLGDEKECATCSLSDFCNSVNKKQSLLKK